MFVNAFIHIIPRCPLCSSRKCINNLDKLSCIQLECMPIYPWPQAYVEQTLKFFPKRPESWGLCRKWKLMASTPLILPGHCLPPNVGLGTILYVVVEVRNQRLGHLTKIAFFARYRRTTLKLVVHQVLEGNLAPRRRYSP